MIQEFNKFICNNCGKEELLVKSSGYPYNKGWRKIHNMLGKVSRINDQPESFEIRDADLCCNECESSFLIKRMENTKLKIPPNIIEIEIGSKEKDIVEILSKMEDV